MQYYDYPIIFGSLGLSCKLAQYRNLPDILKPTWVLGMFSANKCSILTFSILLGFLRFFQQTSATLWLSQYCGAPWRSLSTEEGSAINLPLRSSPLRICDHIALIVPVFNDFGCLKIVQSYITSSRISSSLWKYVYLLCLPNSIQYHKRTFLAYFFLFSKGSSQKIVFLGLFPE